MNLTAHTPQHTFAYVRSSANVRQGKTRNLRRPGTNNNFMRKCRPWSLQRETRGPVNLGPAAQTPPAQVHPTTELTTLIGTVL